MDQLEYRNYFRRLAGQHVQIENDEKDSRFAEIVSSYDPAEKTYDKHFVSLFRSRLKINEGQCAMVLEAMESKWQNPGSEDRNIVPFGTFIILAKSSVNHRDVLTPEMNATLKRTQNVAEDILARIEYESDKARNDDPFSNSEDTFNTLRTLYLEMESVHFYPVGPIESSIFGCRCEFSWKTPRNHAMRLDPDKWIDKNDLA